MGKDCDKSKKHRRHRDHKRYDCKDYDHRRYGTGDKRFYDQFDDLCPEMEEMPGHYEDHKRRRHWDHSRGDRPCRDFMEGVRKAYEDESEAVKFYGRLAELAPNDMVKRDILCIRKDEMRHRDYFESLLSSF